MQVDIDIYGAPMCILALSVWEFSQNTLQCRIDGLLNENKAGLFSY